ncbi:MAG: ACT domain-containing protein [Leptolyngbyaceae cyanobacterium SM2_5_2]|nr:ACT domain-containing protein [Leptolyngbyaceae cyanobacterium SM2_5_2]
MAEETELCTLLRAMQPVLQEEIYVFARTPWVDGGSTLHPIGLFREKEGLTLILPQSQADASGLSYTTVFAMITLSVHSSLEAVGFLAAITTHLASHNISVNPVSAFYHDHLFVPVAKAQTAMALLHGLSGDA